MTEKKQEGGYWYLAGKATVRSADGGWVAHINWRNRDKNAPLIVAAPELLEALKYARRFLRPEDHDTAYVDRAIARAMDVPE